MIESKLSLEMEVAAPQKPVYPAVFQDFLSDTNPKTVFSQCRFLHEGTPLTLSFVRGNNANPFDNPLFMLEPSPFSVPVDFYEIIEYLADEEAPKVYCPWGLLVINGRYREQIIRQVQADQSDLFLSPVYEPLAMYLFHLFKTLPGYGDPARSYKAAFKATRTPQGALALLLEYGNIPLRFLKGCRTPHIMSIKSIEINPANETLVIEYADPVYADLSMRSSAAHAALASLPPGTFPYERRAAVFSEFYNFNGNLLNLPGTLEKHVIAGLIRFSEVDVHRTDIVIDASIREFAYTKQKPLIIPLEDFWCEPQFDTPLEKWLYSLKINEQFTLAEAAIGVDMRKEFISDEIKSLVRRKRISESGKGSKKRYRVLF